MALDDFLKKRSNFTGFTDQKDPDIIGLDFGIMEQEHVKGVQVADSCMIDQMKENFAWMKGHQNCWTGFPNDGKTQFTLFMMMIKSLKSKWKWVIWSPEMKAASYVDGKIKIHYNRLAYDLMASLSGKTPYKHVNEKFKIPLMSIEEKRQQKEWIENHFIFLDPKKKDIKSIYETLKRVWNNHGYDGILIDPFKNIEAEHNVRDDKHLHDVFSKFKDFAVETNTVMNWIAHPKSNVNRVVNKGGQEILVPCNQYMLAGGAAWDNSMDGIYSIQRPNSLEDIKDPSVVFHNLKQRSQEVVADRGMVQDIEFDIKTRRYLFDGHSPLGFAESLSEKQSKYEGGDIFKHSESKFETPDNLPF